MPVQIENPGFSVEKVAVAGNHGPCMGVNRSIVTGKLVVDMVDGREPVHVNHPLVHNKRLAEYFADRGVVDVNFDVYSVPEDGILLRSAHGSDRDSYRVAEERRILTVDTTCQLVTRVIDAGIRAQEADEFVIYNGIANHPEREAVMGHLNPEQAVAVETLEDVDLIDVPEDVLLKVLSQTTLAQRESSKIVSRLRERFGDRIQVPNTTLCYATTNRQESLGGVLEEGVDLAIVIGSKNSHNTKQLRRLGEESEIPTVQIDTVDDIDSSWFTKQVRTVGLTSGASVDEADMRRVIGYFEQRGAQIEIKQPVRDEHPGSFPLPYDDIERVRQRYPTRRDGTIVPIPKHREATIQLEQTS